MRALVRFAGGHLAGGGFFAGPGQLAPGGGEGCGGGEGRAGRPRRGRGHTAEGDHDRRAGEVVPGRPGKGVAARLPGGTLKRKGGTSLDAVEAAIQVLEVPPRFNAARGAVFTHDGRNELDASIMEGKDGRAGAWRRSVASRTRSRRRAVMEKSEHVLLTGPQRPSCSPARQGLEVVEQSYFWTKERHQRS